MVFERLLFEYCFAENVKQIMEIKSKNGLRNACFLVRLLFARLKGKYLWSTPELDYSCLDSQESKDPEI